MKIARIINPWTKPNRNFSIEGKYEYEVRPFGYIEYFNDIHVCIYVAWIGNYMDVYW